MAGKGFMITGVPQVIANLGRAGHNLEKSVAMAMEIISADNENYAKNHRPWTDRTGNARRSITGSSDTIAGGYRSALAIGVFYGKYLELAHGGRFAIVWPTFNARRHEFLETIVKQAKF